MRSVRSWLPLDLLFLHMIFPDWHGHAVADRMGSPFRKPRRLLASHPESIVFYRCRNCNHEEARGILPAASCGIYLLGLMGIASLILVIAIRYIRSIARGVAESTTPTEPATGLGWWVLLVIPIAMVLGFVALFVGAMILKAALELAEWTAYSRRRCPRCGHRRWSWGFTRGFGL